jgi:hypothetical protein
MFDRAWGRIHEGAPGRPVKRALVRGAFAITALSCTRASAQATGGQATADEVRAQSLFNAAKQLRDSGQLADACPMFAESKQLALGVGITLYLADCYERMGRTASAWDQFREAEAMARERGDDKRAEVAHARVQALSPKVDHLTVMASPEPHEGWQVLVNGAPLPPGRWNIPLAADPGDQLVTVIAPGQAPRTLRVHLDAARLAATVRIDDEGAALPAPSPVPPAPLAAPTASGAREPPAHETPASSGGDSARLWIGLSLVGLGVAGASLGAAFLVKKNNLIANGGPCDTPSAEQETTTAATVSFVAGGAALMSALVFYLTAPAAPSQTAWVVAPAPLQGGGGALVRMSF